MVPADCCDAKCFPFHLVVASRRFRKCAHWLVCRIGEQVWQCCTKASGSLSLIGRNRRRKLPLEAGEMAGIGPPPPDRGAVDRLADLPPARRANRTSRQVRPEAGSIERQTAKAQKPAHDRLRVIDQLFVADVEKVAAHMPPC